jgi:hypothetical protein
MVRTISFVGGLAFSLAIALAAPSQAQGFLTSPLTLGVYECHDQMNTPTLDLWFGLLGASSYSNYDGKIGTYTYDPATGVITVSLQGRAGARYLRIGESAFRGVNEDGSLSGHTCPLNRAKDPAHPPW